MDSFEHLPIYDEKDVYLAADIARWLALEIGFPKNEAALLSTATSEICMNALRHAHGGRAEIKRSHNNKGVEVVVCDNGLGISDLEQAFQDGFSTFQSLGLGLGAAKRSVDELHIDNSDSGCCVTLKKFLPIEQGKIETAAVSFPKVGAHVNGDEYLIKSYHGDKLLIAIFDGAGSGEKAAHAAGIAKKHFSENLDLPLTELVQSTHRKLISKDCERGVELVAVRITDNSIESIIIGNTRIMFPKDQSSRTPCNNAALGQLCPEELIYNQFEYDRPLSFLLCSDGIRFFEQTFLDNSNLSAKELATSVFDKFALAEDDASVIAVKISKNGDRTTDNST